MYTIETLSDWKFNDVFFLVLFIVVVVIVVVVFSLFFLNLLVCPLFFLSNVFSSSVLSKRLKIFPFNRFWSWYMLITHIAWAHLSFEREWPSSIHSNPIIIHFNVTETYQCDQIIISLQQKCQYASLVSVSFIFLSMGGFYFWLRKCIQNNITNQLQGGTDNDDDDNGNPTNKQWKCDRHHIRRQIFYERWINWRMKYDLRNVLLFSLLSMYS